MWVRYIKFVYVRVFSLQCEWMIRHSESLCFNYTYWKWLAWVDEFMDMRARGNLVFLKIWCTRCTYKQKWRPYNFLVWTMSDQFWTILRFPLSSFSFSSLLFRPYTQRKFIVYTKFRKNSKFPRALMGYTGAYIQLYPIFKENIFL